ncbi:5-oxoprolinase subunit PxpA [Cellulomonas endophytica]|uniref:5-oxoprolinase subunit PxpA n=1 Tax=Cellulomonas endophytica TaxID=2494735 RepID=UPI001012B7DB|nr:5-oxoprolinase subunit PxpA [Cellulomonas endophytica]
MDLNCDLGEGDGPWRAGAPVDDEALLRLVTSANVAAGYHAGDAASMRATCAAAAARGVGIGAHPSYRDREGFGRRPTDLPAAELTAQVVDQLEALRAAAHEVGATVRHVKPHGALYHRVTHDGEQAAALVAAVGAVDPALAVLGPPGSVVLRLAAAAGLPTVAEAFVDRGYRADGLLVPRGAPGALVTDPAAAGRRAVGLATTGTVTAVDGTRIAVRAASLCVHSDTPGAARLAAAVRAALAAAGVPVRAFPVGGAASGRVPA